MDASTDAIEKQMEQIRRGAADIVPEQELIDKIGRSLETGEPLRVKLGLDPTAPDIHVGNAVPLHKLRVFQNLGHHAVLIVGDYTATVGDPSGANETRPQLSHEEVLENAQTYLDQVGKIVDLEEAEIVYNGEWFGEMTFGEVIQLAAKLTVARCIERDDFARRMDAGQPIGLHELLYPLMQAYDSVMVRSDVELGGTDQIFNILLGRELQREVGQEPQVAVTNPLLEGLDGVEKMSKSKGNYIGISEDPKTIFGKAMSISDELMQKYFILTTDLSLGRIDDLLGSEVHPRDAKEELAAAIVRRYHGEEAVQGARRAFDRVFRQHKLPRDMDELPLPPDALSDGKVWIVELLRRAGYADSNSQARRLVEQGGVRLGPPDDLTAVDDPTADVQVQDGMVLNVGKRRFCRIALAKD
ncbi:MAG: tyrosine--tRNA ligase [Candidatus Brocadiia bacterium]